MYKHFWGIKSKKYGKTVDTLYINIVSLIKL